MQFAFFSIAVASFEVALSSQAIQSDERENRALEATGNKLKFSADFYFIANSEFIEGIIDGECHLEGV